MHHFKAKTQNFNDTIFLKSPKTSFLGTKMLTVQKKNFFQKIRLDRNFSFIDIWFSAKNQKDLMNGADLKLYTEHGLTIFSGYSSTEVENCSVSRDCLNFSNFSTGWTGWSRWTRWTWEFGRICITSAFVGICASFGDSRQVWAIRWWCRIESWTHRHQE